jgi:hypothetical protein
MLPLNWSTVYKQLRVHILAIRAKRDFSNVAKSLYMHLAVRLDTNSTTTLQTGEGRKPREQLL